MLHSINFWVGIAVGLGFVNIVLLGIISAKLDQLLKK
jgi:hypothetical protein